MQKKFIIFICAVLATTLAVSVVTAVHNRSQAQIMENALEPTIIRLIEIFNNANDPECKTMYWDMLSQSSKDKLIQQTGSLEAAQEEVWVMLQGVVETQKKVEYLGLDYKEIQGEIATVVIRVRISEVGKEPTETTVLHRYRWENGEWKFIDWLVEPDMYKG